MNVETACHIILGDKLAHSIISDMGVHWAVIAAMAKATTADDPQAIKTLRDYTRAKTTAAE